MSSGIVNAKAILVVLSRQYKDSPVCRLVAEHALALNKELLYISTEPQFKPDGWLKGVIGNSIIYPLNLEAVDLNFDIILQELELREKLKESADTNAPPVVHQPVNFQCWSITQVVNWLEMNGLAGYQVPFSRHDVDGVTLKNLIQVGKEDIQGLSNILHHYFGIKSWRHQSKILNMLDKLQ